MKRLLALFSWRNWGLVRYNSIWQNVAALFYASLAQRWFGMDYIRDVVIFLIFSLLGTAYGYLVNDLGDIELDRQAGKPNVFHGTSRRQAAVVILASFGLMLAGGLVFVRRQDFLPLWLAWIFAATFYSLPPLRLKKRGLVGLIATILAQQPLPAAMAFAVLGCLRTWGAAAFIAYITLRGISSDVGHQLRDWERDEITGANTFAVRRGRLAVARLYGISLEIEKLLLGVTLVALLLDTEPLNLGKWSVSPAWPLIVIYLILLLLTIGQAYTRLARGERLDPYDESPEGPPRDLIFLIHHAFPSVLLPLYLALWLTMSYLPNAVFVLGIVMLHRLYDPRRWKAIRPVALLANFWHQYAGTLARKR